MDFKQILAKIFYFPLTRIIVGIFLISFALAGTQTLLFRFLNFNIWGKPELKEFIISIVMCIVAIGIYCLLYKYYEKRIISEFSIKKFLKSSLYGALLGFFIQSICILCIYLFGEYKVISIDYTSFIIPTLSMALTSGVIEEIFMRGIVFRISEEKLGSMIAIAISGLVFGLMHIGNEHSSLLMAIAIAIEAGILLALAYIYFRNLWFPIGIHFGWNFTQGGIYGAHVSGHTMSSSLFTSQINGAEWLTGGGFGPEGSIIAVIVCLILSVILYVKCEREGKFIQPFWKI